MEYFSRFFFEKYFPEAIPNAIDSAIRGNFKDDDGSYSDTFGKIVGSLIPAADVRDIIADGNRIIKGEDGSYIKLGASIIGAIPIAGDIAKPIIKKLGKEILEKSAKEIETKVAEKLIKNGSQRNGMRCKAIVYKFENPQSILTVNFLNVSVFENEAHNPDV